METQLELRSVSCVGNKKPTILKSYQWWMKNKPTFLGLYNLVPRPCNPIIKGIHKISLDWLLLVLPRFRQVVSFKVHPCVSLQAG